jgi:hypothetical protein
MLSPHTPEAHVTLKHKFDEKIQWANKQLSIFCTDKKFQAKLQEIIFDNDKFKNPTKDSIIFRHTALLDTIMGNLEILSGLDADLSQQCYTNLDFGKLTDPDNLSQELARALVDTVLTNIHEVTTKTPFDLTKLKQYILETTKETDKGVLVVDLVDYTLAKSTLDKTQTNLETLGRLANNNPEYKVETRGIAEELQTLQRQKDLIFSQIERTEAAQNLADFRDKAQVMANELENMIADYRKGANAMWRGFVYIFSPLLRESTKYSKMLKQQREARAILDQSKKAIVEARASAETETTEDKDIAPGVTSEAARLKVRIDALDRKYSEFHEDALKEKILSIRKSILDNMMHLIAEDDNVYTMIEKHLEIQKKTSKKLLKQLLEKINDPKIALYSEFLKIGSQIDSQIAVLKRIQRNLEIVATLSDVDKKDIYHKIALLDPNLSTEQLSKEISRIVVSAAHGHAENYGKKINESEKELLKAATRQIQLTGSGAQQTVDIEKINERAKELAQELENQKKCIDALAQIIDMNNPDLTKRTIRGYGTLYKRYVTFYSTSPDGSPLDPDAIILSKDIHETLTKQYQEVSTTINQMISTKSAFDSQQKAEKSIAELEKQVGSLLNITRMYLKVFVYCVPAIYRWASSKEQSATWKEINKHFTYLDHLRQARKLREVAQAAVKTPSKPVAQELERRVDELEKKIEVVAGPTI